MNFAWAYVAVLYAIAVALARRAGVELPRRVAALFYALVLLFLFKPLTGPYVNVAPDVLYLIPPWSAAAPAGFDKYDVSNYELQDIVFQFIPWTQNVHESWRALKPPLWNPLAACGMPLMANMQSGALSPLRLATIGLPMPYAFHAEAALKLLVALTFAFLYCRRRYGVLPSLVGAIGFGFGTFMTTWLHFPHPNVAAFTPAVLYAIDLLAEGRTRGRVMFAIALGPTLLFAGHPETAAHTVFFATLYAAWLILVERVKGLLTTLLAVSLLSLLASLPVLLPFLEILPHSTSYATARAQEHESGTAFSDFHSLALLVHPRIYGQRPGPLWGNAATETISGFAGLIAVGAFFGMLVHVIAGRRFREREMFYLLATILAYAVIADLPYLSAPVKQLFALALNYRFRLQFAFLLAVQLAALVHYRKRSELLAAAGGAIAALAFVMVRTPFPNEYAKDFAVAATLPGLAGVALTALLVFKRVRLIALPLLAAALYVELWTAAHSWHPTRRVTDIYRRTPVVDALREEQARHDQPYRFLGLGPVLFPNTHAPFGLEDVRVKDALSSAAYVDLLAREVKGFDVNLYYMKWPDPDTPLIDRLNVRWVMTEPGVELDPARYRRVYDGHDGRVYENTRVLPRFFSPDASIRVARYTGDAYELHVEAKRSTRIASSVGFWPGWRITRSGESLVPRRVDEAFLGFDVPAGRSVIRLRYFPLSFWLGAAVSLLTVGLVFFLYHPPPCSIRRGSTAAPSTPLP